MQEDVSRTMPPSLVHGESSNNYSSSSQSQSLSREPVSPVTPLDEITSGSTQKPKQKRNKPTLSCRECVDRKTKCDRGRPKCSACEKRPSDCEYTSIATLQATSDGRPLKSRKTNNHRTSDSSLTKCSIDSITNKESATPPTLPPQQGNATLKEYSTRTAVSLNSLPLPNAAPINIFDIGSEHPFENFWTMKGGVAEVVGVLPRKEQADILLAKFFDAVDPLYPIIGRDDFLADYEYFWSLPLEEKNKFDAATLALHFVIYANATQFMELGGAAHEARKAAAEFYISAAHQALRLSSYWNHITIPTIQSMLKTFYFLINDNHVSDAWTCTGISVRQAQVLQLNRDPKTVRSDARASEQLRRLTIWQTLITQDSVLALNLKLPSTTGLDDITSESWDLNFDDEYDERDTLGRNLDTYPIPLLSKRSLELDCTYSKCLWQIATWQQEHICKPRSLDLPICKSLEHRRQLTSEFRDIWNSFPYPFASPDPNRFYLEDIRLARQVIAVTGNFFLPMMIMLSDTNEAAGVPVDVFAALEAAHESMISFFAFQEIRGSEVNGFWAFQHRAFEVAVRHRQMVPNWMYSELY